jgi:hypothetical protein
MIKDMFINDYLYKKYTYKRKENNQYRSCYLIISGLFIIFMLNVYINDNLNKLKAALVFMSGQCIINLILMHFYRYFFVSFYLFCIIKCTVHLSINQFILLLLSLQICTAMLIILILQILQDEVLDICTIVITIQ